MPSPDVNNERLPADGSPTDGKARKTCWLERNGPILLAIVCMILSVSWVFLAPTATDAGRGGALATAMVLIFLFSAKSPGEKVFLALTKESEEVSAAIEGVLTAEQETPQKVDDKATATKGDVAGINTRIDKMGGALLAYHRTNARASRSNNLWMAAASACATICWGFGDCIHTRAYGGGRASAQPTPISLQTAVPAQPAGLAEVIRST